MSARINTSQVKRCPTINARKEGPVESMEVNAGHALCGGITLHAISHGTGKNQTNKQTKPELSTGTDGAHFTMKSLFTSDEDLRQRCCSVPGRAQHCIDTYTQP